MAAEESTDYQAYDTSDSPEQTLHKKKYRHSERNTNVDI